jgi:hypothetical protein
MSATVSATGRFVSKTGTALIGGTLTRSLGTEAHLFGDVLQDRGRPAMTIGGFGLGFEEPIASDGSPTPWNVEAFPSAGDKYADGPAAVSVTAFLRRLLLVQRHEVEDVSEPEAIAAGHAMATRDGGWVQASSASLSSWNRGRPYATRRSMMLNATNVARNQSRRTVKGRVMKLRSTRCAIGAVHHSASSLAAAPCTG